MKIKLKHHWPPQILQKVDEITMPFIEKERWMDLRIPHHAIPSSAILLQGLAGTGKTTLAKDILGVVMQAYNDTPYTGNASPIEISMGDVGGYALGSTEKEIKSLFTKAKKMKQPAIFMDEIDGIGYSRAMTNTNNAFMLSIVDTLLVEIDKFLRIGGILTATTNHAEKLDPSLLRRFTDKIELTPRTGSASRELFKRLMPAKPFGCEIPQSLIDTPLTANDIEKMINMEVRKAFVEKRNMKL